MSILLGSDWTGAGLHHQPAYAGYQHSITLCTARLQQRRPTKNRAANWWQCILCRCTSCMESPTDRTRTHAVVDSNIQAPSEVFSFSHGVLTMHLRADCTRRTTKSAVTVTVTTTQPGSDVLIDVAPSSVLSFHSDKIGIVSLVALCDTKNHLIS